MHVQDRKLSAGAVQWIAPIVAAFLEVEPGALLVAGPVCLDHC